MAFARVICLDDLTRSAFWPAKEFFYDLVRAPIHLACGQDIAKSPRNGQRNNLAPGFDPSTFLRLAGVAAQGEDWPSVFWSIPSAAADYLASHIEADALVIGYEMPPWLSALLAERDIAFMDMRLSPLRFGADLYVAVRTNRSAIHDAVFGLALRPDRIMVDACLMSASVRHERRYRPDNLSHDNCVVYVGQTGDDASLVRPDGQFARAADHAEDLRALAAQGEFLYKPHPYAGEFAQAEHALLGELLGKLPRLCHDDMYELLGADDALALVGISSGALQEAEWFGKPAACLFQPVCRLGYERGHDAQSYLQFQSHVFLGETFWSAVLADGRTRCDPVDPPPRANMLRELHNAWWGYSTYATRNSRFFREAFAHAGGKAQEDAIVKLASTLSETLQHVAALQTEVRSLKEALRVAVRHVTPGPAPGPGAQAAGPVPAAMPGAGAAAATLGDTSPVAGTAAPIANASSSRAPAPAMSTAEPDRYVLRL